MPSFAPGKQQAVVRSVGDSARMVTMLTELDGVPIEPVDGWRYAIHIVDGTKNAIILCFIHDVFDCYI